MASFREGRALRRPDDCSTRLRSVLRAPGEPLRNGDAEAFGRQLGLDLTAVRIHADPVATASAADVGTRAYAVGRHVVFGQAEYRPDDAAGRHLLAHELAHVAQQGAGPDAPVPDTRTCSTPALEAQAHGFAAGRGAVALTHTSAPAVMGWDSPEHVELGDLAQGGPDGYITLECHERDFPERTDEARWPLQWRTLIALGTPDQKRAVTRGLTYGEVVALAGDFYRGVAELQKASLREIYDLIPLIRAGGDTGQLQAATGGRYLALAAQNVGHFSTGPAGTTNLDLWRRIHGDAVGVARSAGGDASKRNAAWTMNATADHFLTDAFSAGHLRTPRAQLVEQGAFGNLESKILHDLDNEHGVDVTNMRGDRAMTAYGDEHLDDPRNAENRRRALDAVELSKRDINQALVDPGAVLGPPYAAEQLVPRPVDPSRDRWSGRVPAYVPTPTGNMVRVEDDWTQTRRRVVTSEGPGVLQGALSRDDDDVRSWVARNTTELIGRQPVEEKIRMIDTLIGGFFSWISEDDVRTIERICGSVTSAAEMAVLRRRFFDEVGERMTSISQRTRVRVALSRF